MIEDEHENRRQVSPTTNYRRHLLEALISPQYADEIIVDKHLVQST